MVALWNEGTQYVFDLTPMCAILLFHHHNYKDKRSSSRINKKRDSSNEKKEVGRVESEKHVLDLDVTQFLETTDSKFLDS